MDMAATDVLMKIHYASATERGTHICVQTRAAPTVRHDRELYLLEAFLRYTTARPLIHSNSINFAIHYDIGISPGGITFVYKSLNRACGVALLAGTSNIVLSTCLNKSVPSSCKLSSVWLSVDDTSFPQDQRPRVRTSRRDIPDRDLPSAAFEYGVVRHSS